jgi:hypothetical protein
MPGFPCRSYTDDLPLGVRSRPAAQGGVSWCRSDARDLTPSVGSRPGGQGGVSWCRSYGDDLPRGE